MHRRLAISLGLAAFLAASSAFGQTGQSTVFPVQTPGVNAPGSVDMCTNSSGIAVPCSDLSPLSVRVSSQPDQNAPYPTGAIPITGNAAGSTGAVIGTLAAAQGKTTFMCGFSVSAIGGTAAVGPITIAGITGSAPQVYQGSSSAAGGTVASGQFWPCIPAPTLNTAITITTTADGTASAVDVNSWGFQR